MADLTGTSSADVLTGTNTADRLYGGAGTDTLSGLAGSDELYGGDGTDKLYGGDGDDTVDGGQGTDLLQGGAGRDLLTGGQGDDTIDGGADTDTATYAGNRSDFLITTKNGVTTVKDLRQGTPEGTDKLTNVERLVFSDGTTEYLAPNRSPTIGAISAGSVTEDEAAKIIDLLAGASDLDGDAVSVVANSVTASSSNASRPVTVIVSGNSVAIDPAQFNNLAAGQQETVTVSYSITDGQGTSVLNTATLVVTGANDAPVVSGAVIRSATEDGASVSVNALTNASDVDAGAALSVVGVPSTLPAGVSYDASTGVFTLDPTHAAFQGLAAGATTTVTVAYGVSDGTATTPASVSWTVTGTNDAPVVTGAVNAVATEDGASVSVNALTNASDVDAGAALSVVGVPSTLPAGVSYDASTGVFTLDPTHAAFQGLAAGATTTVTVAYGVSDGTATTPASVSWTVTGTNDAPVVTGAVNAVATEDGASVSVNALTNASDVDAGAALSVVGVPSTLPAGVSYDASTGVFTLDPTHAAFQGLAAGATTTVTVAYGVSDGTATTPASVSWTVTGTNDAPNVEVRQDVIDFADRYPDLNNYEGFQFNGFSWDMYAGTAGSPAASFSSAASPTGSDANIKAVDGGTLSIASMDIASQGYPQEVTIVGLIDGVVVASVTVSLTNFYYGEYQTVQFDEGWSQVDEIQFLASINDPYNGVLIDNIQLTSTSASAIVSERLDGATDENALPAHGAAGTIVFTDVDSIDVHTATMTPQGGGEGYLGALTLGEVNQDGRTVSWTFNVEDAVLDGLREGQVVTQNYVVTIDDGNGGTVQQTVTIKLTGTNDAPVVSGAVTRSATEDGASVSVNALSNASDVDAGATLSVVGVSSTLPAGVSYDASTGVFTLDPTHAAFQGLAAGATTTVTVAYGVSDGTATTPASVQWTVTGTNDEPVITALPGDTSSATLVETNGGLMASGTSTVIDADTSDEVTVAVREVEVFLSNGVLGGDVVIPQDGLTDAQIAALGLDRETLLGAFTVHPTDNPSGGTYTHDGTANTLTWDFNSGDESFDFLNEGEVLTLYYDSVRPNDGHGETTTGDGGIVVRITGSNDAPVVASLDAGSVSEDAALQQINLLQNASDVDTNASLAVQNIVVTDDLGNPVTFIDNGDGTISIDPAQFNGLDDGQDRTLTVNFEVTDGIASTPGTASLVVTGSNDNYAPIAGPDDFSTTEDTLKTGNVLTNDSDADGDPLTVSAVNGLSANVGQAMTLASGATLTVQANGSYAYNPNKAFESLAVGSQATETFTYTVSDGKGGTDTQSVTVTITGANDAPTVTGALASQTVAVNAAFSLALPASLFTEVDSGDSLTWSATRADGTALPSWLIFDPVTQTFGGTPALTDAGTTLVRITVTDESGAKTYVDVPLTVLDGNIITGTDAGETLTGTINGDRIDARGGNDVVNGLPGSDNINGGAGSDQLNGEAGDDVIEGGLDGDTLRGGDGNDLLYGQDGGDILLGENGDDQLFGGNDIDLFDGGNGNDSMFGGDGNDQLGGGGGSDWIEGGAGDDILSSNGNGVDAVFGQDGNDTITIASNAGVQTADGGAGNDTIQFANRFFASTITTGSGTDLISITGLNSGTAAMTVTDFTSGAGGDKFNLAAGNGVLSTLSGWDGSSNPFGSGFLRLVQVGAHTELQWDSNGITGGSAWQTLAVFQNTVVGDFTSDNFVPPYSPDGAAPAGQTITGTTNGEILAGTIGADTVDALGGNDTVNAGPGGDTVFGGAGSDQLNGEAGDDVIEGGLDGDTLRGGDGNDLLYGQDGGDILLGENGDDQLFGGNDIDLFDGGNGNDSMFGGDGNDQLGGGGGSDWIEGGAGDDILSSNGNGVDAVFGQDGNDTITIASNAGVQTADGGAGNDTIQFANRFFASTITTGSGTDLISITGLNSGTAAMTVTDFTSGAGGDKFNLAAGNGVLSTLSGWDGSSNPFGSGFLRLVQVGAHTELQWDSNGITGGSAWQTLAVFQNTVVGDFTSDNFVPPYSPDGAAPAGQTITGTTNGEILAGTIGADTVDALGGNDTVNAGPGGDTVFGGAGSDQLNGEAGDDVIEGGLDGDTLRGGDGNDLLYGQDGGDILLGENGDDQLFGGNDIDLFDGGNGNDSMFGGDGNDQLGGGGGSDWIEGGAGDDILSSNGNGVDAVFGQDGNDTITIASNAGVQTADGGAGNDTIQFANRFFASTITTGSGTDLISITGLNSGTAAMTVTDFTSGAGGDKFNLAAGNGVLSTLSGWDGSSNPFGSGFLRLVQVGAHTELQWDSNGITGGSAWQTLAVFQNTVVGDFTSDNFVPPYPPDGSGIFGTTLTGTGAADVLTGTIGDDSILGLGDSDTLSGGNGADVINGGDGDDRIVGGFAADSLAGGNGADTFVFNFASEGVDEFVDFTSGEDRIAVSAAGFGGGLTVGGSATLVAASSAASASNGGSNGYFIFDSDGADAGSLWWDQNGGSGADAVLVADGLSAIAASDIFILA